MRNLFLCFLLSTLLAVSACNSGPKAIVVSVASPSGAQALDLGQSLNITVSVSNDTLNKGVTFTLSGVGALSNQTSTGATYTAPATGGGGTATVTVTSAADPTKSTTVTIVVTAPPSITTASLAAAVVGTSYSGTVAVTGGAGTLNYSVTIGNLPAGLSLNATTGAITGTATGPTGTVSFTVQVKDSSTVSPQTTTKALSITVNQAPAITSANSAAFTAGAAGSFTVTATGTPTPSLTETGALPAGVTFVDNGNGTGTLSGTAGATGAYPLTFTASNGVGTNATQLFTLTIGQAAAITSSNSTTFTVGTAGTFSVTTSGFPSPALTETGALPTGVTFVDNHNGTATLAGTPAAAMGGTYSLAIKAHNGIGADATQTFTLTVDEAPAITSANSATFTVGSAGTFSVTATGFPAPSLTQTGALPTGVTFTPATGTLAGTPAAGSSGTYTLTLKATNSVSSATQTFTLTVDEAPAITSANSTTFTVGTPGTFSVTATGLPAPTLSQTAGALPTGVTFTPGTGTLAGTPAVGTGGTYTLTFKATNSVSSVSQTFTLTVDEAPAITSANSATFAVGSSGSFSVTTTGFPHPALTQTGVLPTGVTFVDNGNGTASLAGTPAAGSSGTYTLTLKASNGVGSNATQTLTLTVNQAPAITSANSTTFTVGTPGTFSVTATGLPAPTLSQTAGALPTGVTFTPGTGTLAGTPAVGTGGTYTLTFKATNSVSSVSQTFTLTVDEAPAITSASSTTFSVGGAGTFSVTTSGFPRPALTKTGALPTGVTFVDNGNGTATLAGTPASGTAGAYPLTLTAANGVGSNATQTFTLTVNNAPVITSANSTTFTAGSAGSFTITATGTPTPSITVTGALPTGVTFVDNGNGTASLAGTPGATTGGTYQLSLKAHNGVGTDATQTFTLTVDQAPSFTSANSITFTVGTPGSFSVTATGFPTPSLTETGALPSGVTFVDNGNGTATLAGTPAMGSGGTYPLTLQASNGVGSNATQSFTLTVVVPPLVITPSSGSLPAGVVSTVYTDTLSASGGVSPYTFTLNGGSGPLPPGLTLSTSGQITGTPTTSGTYPFTVLVTDSAAPTPNTKTASLSITVSSATLSCSDAPTGHESMLSGQYAFLLQGFKGSGNGNPLAMVASFHADGAGNITTGGDFDVNDGNAVHATINAGTYRVGLDSTSSGNLGCVLLPLSVGGTAEFRFSLGGLSGGILYKGRIIEYDDATGTGSRGSGVLLRQDPTQFGLSHLHSRYAFGNDGVDSSGGHFASGGSFTVNTSGSMTNGYNDVDDNGALTTGVTGGTGTIGTVSTTTGRATMSTSYGGNTGTSVDYMVNANEIFFIGTDPLSSSSVYTGRAIVTGSSFTQSSLNGNYIVHLTRISTGCNGGNPCAGVTLGLTNLNGTTGAFTGTIYDYDINQGGSSQTITSGAGATYTVNATSGRTTINGAGSGAPVLYIASPTANTEPISAFLISTDSAAAFGFAELQPAGTYSAAGLAGNYFVGNEDPGDNTVGDETQVASLASNGAVTGSGYKSNQSGLATKTISGGAVTMNSNGIGTTGPNSVAITNGNRLFFIDQTPQATCQLSPNPCSPAKITVVEKQ